jgi:U1 small nuclear ribonucleoprotein 70kDa
MYATITLLGQPFKDKNITDTNPYKTVFVGRLSYTTTEERIRQEFEIFG